MTADTTLPRGLPYGVVMATAGASALAGRCGFGALVAPLLLLAVLQAVWIPLAATWRRRGQLGLEWRRRCAIGPAHAHAGFHTVPLGLAVITGGFVVLGARTASAWPSWLAYLALALAWLLTLLSVGRFVWSMFARPLQLATLDGAWFLAPAALLGAGMAAAEVAPLAHPAAAQALRMLALAAVAGGYMGYWIVAIAALLRVSRFGLGGVPQAPWWIAMGCAGLAAAAVGDVLDAAMPGSPARRVMLGAMLAVAVFAVLLCVPVLVLSARFLLRRCRFRDQAKWPPTFSTAVFALGCLATGEALQSAVFHWLGLGAAYATLLFWVITAGWNLVYAVAAWWQLRRGRARTVGGNQ